LNYTTNSLNKN